MTGITRCHVGTAALGCPAERSSAAICGCGIGTARAGRPRHSRRDAGATWYLPFLLVVVACVQQGQAQSFNAARAMQYTREVVAFGARPIGSANHKKLENYILGHLKGDSVGR